MTTKDTEATTRYTLYPRRYYKSARAKALMHLLPAFLLVGGLLPLLQGQEPLTLVLALEVSIGIAYLLLMIRELRHLRHPTPHAEPVAWLELAAAGILGLEGYHIWHRHHQHELATGSHRLHVLPWLYALAAAMYAGLAFGTARLASRRYLHLPATGFDGRLRLLDVPFQFEWAQIRTVTAQEPATVLIYPQNTENPQHLSFAHLLHGVQHRDRLVAHALAYLPADTTAP